MRINYNLIISDESRSAESIKTAAIEGFNEMMQTIEKGSKYLKPIYYILLVCLLTSCGKYSSPEAVEEIIPIPENLPEYFQSLLATDDYMVPYHGDSIDAVPPIIRSFTLLQQYVDGKTDKYPAWSVKQSLSTMSWEIAYSESHFGSWIEAISFFEAYLKQAFRICPDVKLLTSLSSDDGKISILTFDGCDLLPLFCYLIYTGDDGCYHLTRWATSKTYTRIYTIEHDGEQYYLLNHSDSGYKDFYIGFVGGMSLVSLTKKRPKECLQPLTTKIEDFINEVNAPFSNERINQEKIIFNPKNLTWKQCQKNKNGYWAEFPGSKTLRLKFGRKIKIVME
jgi:hypothetical protein